MFNKISQKLKNITSLPAQFCLIIPLPDVIYFCYLSRNKHLWRLDKFFTLSREKLQTEQYLSDNFSPAPAIVMINKYDYQHYAHTFAVENKKQIKNALKWHLQTMQHGDCYGVFVPSKINFSEGHIFLCPKSLLDNISALTANRLTIIGAIPQLPPSASNKLTEQALIASPLLPHPAIHSSLQQLSILNNSQYYFFQAPFLSRQRLLLGKLTALLLTLSILISFTFFHYKLVQAELIQHEKTEILAQRHHQYQLFQKWKLLHAELPKLQKTALLFSPPSQPTPSAYLTALSSINPTGITLLSCGVDNGQFFLQGECNDKKLMHNYEQTLQKIPLLKNLHCTQLVTKSDKINFHFRTDTIANRN